LADNPLSVGIRAFFDDQTTRNISSLERPAAYREYEVFEPTNEFKTRRYLFNKFLEITEDAKFKPGFLNQMRGFSNGE